VGRGKPGVALLALRSKAPVYPARITGGPSSRHWVGAWLWPSQGVRVTFGPAVDLSPYYGRRITRQLLREVTDLFMEKIEALGPRGRADAAGVAGGRINAPVKAPAAAGRD
jgi:1-acyl-sn-glycerol-3-phosphate acyltransferase